MANISKVLVALKFERLTVSRIDQMVPTLIWETS